MGGKNIEMKIIFGKNDTSKFCCSWRELSLVKINVFISETRCILIENCLNISRAKKLEKRICWVNGDTDDNDLARMNTPKAQAM
jgi:hypothetical protein